ncbi:hypothetical protein CYMTET_50732 [Cymbomonas tetramitiformis]|uniref:Uncharacterized protein n=1 Tax=Cymbomonas tetramitiformis TaxID=36881 RepID=A0AAE0ET67_9CHLO|nr:hypothetical protein CYMTET_50732 [Cymbomonas tetramitiformis]
MSPPMGPRTPLHEAADRPRTIQCAETLLLEGVNVDARDEHGMTPLHLAARSGQTTMMENLLQAGADVSAHDKDGRTPLLWAMTMGCTTMVKALLQAGADVNVRNKDGQTPLLWATLMGYATMVKALLQAGADVNVRNKTGKTPLHLAAKDGHRGNMEALWRAGADVNARDERGQTPLHLAVEHSTTFTVNALLQAGADVNARDKDGRTPVHLAAKEAENVEPLIQAGADVNVHDERGQTPLLLAVECGWENIVKALLQAGAHVNARDKGGATSLHAASMHGNDSSVQALLAAGAVTEVRDKDGRTPLDWATWRWATWRGCTTMVNALSQAGADVSAHDKDASLRHKRKCTHGEVPSSSKDLQCKDKWQDLAPENSGSDLVSETWCQREVIRLASAESSDTALEKASALPPAHGRSEPAESERQCPHCKVRVLKVDGCARVKCQACKKPFCFTCGEGYAGGELHHGNCNFQPLQVSCDTKGVPCVQNLTPTISHLITLRIDDVESQPVVRTRTGKEVALNLPASKASWLKPSRLLVLLDQNSVVLKIFGCRDKKVLRWNFVQGSRPQITESARVNAWVQQISDAVQIPDPSDRDSDDEDGTSIREGWEEAYLRKPPKRRVFNNRLDGDSEISPIILA